MKSLSTSNLMQACSWSLKHISLNRSLAILSFALFSFCCLPFSFGSGISNGSWEVSTSHVYKSKLLIKYVTYQGAQRFLWQWLYQSGECGFGPSERIIVRVVLKSIEGLQIALLLPLVLKPYSRGATSMMHRFYKMNQLHPQLPSLHAVRNPFLSSSSGYVHLVPCFPCTWVVSSISWYAR